MKKLRMQRGDVIAWMFSLSVANCKAYDWWDALWDHLYGQIPK